MARGRSALEGGPSFCYTLVMLYVAKVFGWMTIIDAPTKREAVSIAKRRASSASLLPTDVNESHVTPATDEDVAWFKGMSGE